MDGPNEVESSRVRKPTQIGEKFEGILKGRKTLTGHNGKPYTQFLFDQMETDIKFKLSGAVLESKLAGVPDGSQVLLTFREHLLRLFGGSLGRRRRLGLDIKGRSEDKHGATSESMQISRRPPPRVP
jgi:hypothetical protein